MPLEYFAIVYAKFRGGGGGKGGQSELWGIGKQKIEENYMHEVNLTDDLIDLNLLKK